MQDSERQKRANRFVRGVNIGLAGAFALVAAVSLDLYELVPAAIAPLGAAGLAMVAYDLGTTIRDRGSDEYSLALWHAGTGFALSVFVAIAICVPAILVGLAATGNNFAGGWEPGRLPIRWEAAIVCLAFFGAIRRRMRGASR